MSKSKGNVIEPQMILDKYGADVLRFWSSSSKLGEDTNYQEKDFITGKRTVTKLFNASKLILMNLKDYKDKKPEKLELIDSWLLWQSPENRLTTAQSARVLVLRPDMIHCVYMKFL